MAWYLASLALFVHVFCWGAGLAALTLPRSKRLLWPAFAPAAGLALQVLVVALMEFVPLAGTDSYAQASLAVPASLAAVAWWCHGPRKPVPLLAAAWRFVRRWWMPAAVLAGVLLLVLAPIAQNTLPVTAVSLGSCDAGDYAGGARLFKEFGPNDRSGVIGQVETVQVGSTRDFRTFWKRLNHFAPAAVMALGASVVGPEVHEVTSTVPVMLLVALAATTFLWARAGLRFGGLGALVLAAAIGSSPVVSYAVYHVAPAQLMAAAGVAVCTWAAVEGYRSIESGAGWRRWTAVLAIGMWLVWSSYNFFMAFALGAVGGWGCWQVFRRRRAKVLATWVCWLAAVALVGGLAMPERILGLWERLASFGIHDFGWPLPGLRPEGWLGAVTAPGLEPATGMRRVFGWMLLAGCVAFFALGRRESRARRGLVPLIAIPLAGYAILLWKAAAQGDLSSYSAYKLIAVLLPIVVGVLCPWLGLRRRDSAWLRAASAMLAILLVMINVTGTLAYGRWMRPPPLIVGPGLPALQGIEALPRVDAINMRVSHFWSRLWANAYLLRKQQFFSDATYEGRAVSPLRARFDLCDDIVRVTGTNGLGPVFEAPGFQLVDREAPGFVEPIFGEGWFGAEVYGADTWRWSTGVPRLNLRRSTAEPVRRARLVVDIRAAEEREVVMRLNGREVWRGRLGPPRRVVSVDEVEFAPGDNLLEFDSPSAVTQAPPGDPRTLLVALFHLEVVLGEAR